MGKLDLLRIFKRSQKLPNSEEIRGVWITNRPHSQVLASTANIAEAMDFLQAHGFNLIFPVVWNRGYTLYPSQVMAEYQLPKIGPFYKGRDPLAEIIAAAHQRQIKVIPWLEYGFAASHLATGGHIIQQYPDWRAIAQNGETVRHGGLTWMNAFNPEVQKFMGSIMGEIVGNYDVDGIQGCDRLPALPVDSGYDQDTITQYQNAFGTRPNSPQDRQWVQWRADKLTNFLATVYAQIKTIKPQAIVSLSPAVFPFCLNNLLQDYPAWIDQGIVDVIHPQIYRSNFLSYNQELKKIANSFTEDALTKFAPGIALTANGKDLSPQDLGKCIAANRGRHFGGQVFFHYEGLRKNNDAVAIALLKNASYDCVASLPKHLC